MILIYLRRSSLKVLDTKTSVPRPRIKPRLLHLEGCLDDALFRMTRTKPDFGLIGPREVPIIQFMRFRKIF